MEQRGPRIPEYKLDIFTDPASAKEIVKGKLWNMPCFKFTREILDAESCIGILHTIFFHRYFLPITPMCRDVLDLTLPVVEDDDLETLIDQRATSVVRALETPPAGYVGNSSNGQSRVQVVLQFCETKRKKTYFFGSAEDQICWEQWILDVACARPKTDIGKFHASYGNYVRH